MALFEKTRDAAAMIGSELVLINNSCALDVASNLLVIDEAFSRALKI